MIEPTEIGAESMHKIRNWRSERKPHFSLKCIYASLNVNTF